MLLYLLWWLISRWWQIDAELVRKECWWILPRSFSPVGLPEKQLRPNHRPAHPLWVCFMFVEHRTGVLLQEAHLGVMNPHKKSMHAHPHWFPESLMFGPRSLFHLPEKTAKTTQLTNRDKTATDNACVLPPASDASWCVSASYLSHSIPCWLVKKYKEPVRSDIILVRMCPHCLPLCKCMHACRAFSLCLGDDGKSGWKTVREKKRAGEGGRECIIIVLGWWYSI